MSKIDEIKNHYSKVLRTYRLHLATKHFEEDMEHLRPYVALGELYIKILDNTRTIKDNMELANQARALIKQIKGQKCH